MSTYHWRSVSAEHTEADLHLQDPVSLGYPSSVSRTTGQDGTDVLEGSVEFPVDAPQLSSFANLPTNVEAVAGLRLDDPDRPRTRRHHRCVLACGARGGADDRAITGCRRESRPSSVAFNIRHLIHRPEPHF